ncbi:MAG: serine/threonine protein kinase [Acidobacteria bacterium]|nr:serine/threonine protein kinase [Acidobacteriota bacterium]MBI3263798.1 serine/threonine protein kinase [Acidobacteriota bacterium]
MESLGEYKILDRLGEGGIGEVFRARDTRHGRTVAIKLVREDLIADDGRRERFIADAQAAMRLSHPNIATLFEVAEDGGRVFVVSEYVAGDRLDAVVSGTPLNARRAVDLALQLADALAEAHASGSLHRDLRPENVIVTRKGQAKLLDTGLAAWTRGGAAREGAAGQVAAHPTVALATAAYLAPEQALGMTGDERTDVYCLGAILYDMIAGRPPFAGASAVDITLQVLQAPPVRPSRLNPAVPRDLETLVLNMLAKSPVGRPASAALVSASLRGIAGSMEARGSADANAPAGFPGPGRQPHQSWGWWVAGAVGLMTCLLAWLWSR